jgi:HAD superfamily hydrolase (TIGR01450 family)
MTSGYAAALYLSKKSRKGSKVYVIGGKGLKKELTDAGLKVFKNSDNGNVPDYVVVGLDMDFNYKKLKKALLFLSKGAEYIATNDDVTCPVEDEMLPGAGSIVAAITAASGKTPLIIGKPGVLMMREIFKLTQTAPKDTFVIGDRPDTDIVFGKNAGARTVLVLTGVTNALEAAVLKSRKRPDYILKGVSNIKDIL